MTVWHVRAGTADDVYAGTLPFESWWLVYSYNDERCYAFESFIHASEYRQELNDDADA